MDKLECADKFVNVGNGPGYADRLKSQGYTHVVSLRAGLTRTPACLIAGQEYRYSLWCGFAFFKEQPDLTRLEAFATQGMVLMENRGTFVRADTRELTGGISFDAAELSASQFAEWLNYFGAKVEDSFAVTDTPSMFYSAPAKTVA